VDSLVSMPKGHRLNGCLSEIELGFGRRETTPRLLMKPDIQIHLAKLSLSNTILMFDIWCQTGLIHRSQLGTQSQS
jgi:hypothetical protein